jgi:signal transduction histidine kinase
LIVSLLLIHGFALLWLLGIGGDGPPEPPVDRLQRQIAAVWLIDHTAPAGREALLAELTVSDPRLGLEKAGILPVGLDWSAQDKPPPLRSGLAVGIETAVLAASPSGATDQADTINIAFRLGDGAVYTGASERGRPPPLGGPAMITIVFLAVTFIVLGLWATRSLTAPLRQFSSAVEAFGRDGVEPVALAEQGPDEVRRAASAFNRMQQRINRLVEDRMRMLAAVGHDLRTPITRLRLRADYVQDDALRSDLLGNLDHMDALLKGALAYLSDGRSGEETALVDLPSLLSTISDQWADQGVPVPFDGPTRLRISGRPSELMRLFGNLANNAVTHGGGGRIVLAVDDGRVQVDIIDSGPGIATDLKADMMAPFTRGDTARTMHAESGFGLGLAICEAIVKGHGGRLMLVDTPGGGLTARVTLPLAESA